MKQQARTSQNFCQESLLQKPARKESKDIQPTRAELLADSEAYYHIKPHSTQAHKDRHKILMGFYSALMFRGMPVLYVHIRAVRALSGLARLDNNQFCVAVPTRRSISVYQRHFLQGIVVSATAPNNV